MQLDEETKALLGNIQKDIAFLYSELPGNMFFDVTKPFSATPAEPKEEYYRKWINGKQIGFTVGKIYLAERELLDGDVAYLIFDDTDEICCTNQNESEPATKADFLAQQSVGGEIEWKEGEWCKWNGRLYFIKIMFINDFYVDNQNYEVENVDKASCIKPNQKEIETHLAAIAKEKYPIGIKVQPFFGIMDFWLVETHNFLMYNGALCSENKNGTITTLWQNGEWATILEPTVDSKEREHSIFDVSIYQNPIETDNYGIQISAEQGRKFTKEFTEKTATAIKQLLKTTK